MEIATTTTPRTTHALPPRRKAVVLVNGKAGATSSEEEVGEVVLPILAAGGIDAEILSVPPAELIDRARAAIAQGTKLVIAAGGDSKKIVFSGVGKTEAEMAQAL